MAKLWLIAKNEYRKRAGQKSFLMGTLLVPFAIMVLIALTIFLIERESSDQPLGFVDYSGILAGAPAPDLDEDAVAVIEFTTPQAAQAALQAGQIQAYYVIPETYPEVLEVDIFYWEDWPDGSVQRDFDDYIRGVLLNTEPTAIQTRIMDGAQVVYQSADGQREFREDYGFIALLFPIFVAMFFMFSVTGTSGYFLQAVTDEKENRTMEIVITSVSPGQLIGGKSLGLVGVALTQVLIWIGTILGGWLVAQQFIPELLEVHLPLDTLVLFALYFIPALALIAAFMIALGAIVAEYQEGQQISGVLSLLFIFPIFLTMVVFASPDSPLLIFLSFWPTTSFLTIILRWGFTSIPTWQLVVSYLLLLGSTLASLWVAARLLRLGMLRYGQRISLKAALAALRKDQSGSADEAKQS